MDFTAQEFEALDWTHQTPTTNEMQQADSEENNQIEPVNSPSRKRARDGQTTSDKPNDAKSKIRHIRVKDLGTRLKPGEQRNKRIIEEAVPLPEGNRLRSRAIYWFVTLEEVHVIIEDTKSISVKEQAIIECDDQKYYLTQIDFQRNKQGTVIFAFDDGNMEYIECCKTNTPNKRVKRNPEETNEAMIDYASQELVTRTSTMAIENTTNNTNQIQPSFESKNVGWTVQAPVLYPTRASPLLIVNFLLLVPDESYLNHIDAAMKEMEFVKEVSSSNQHLYSQKDSDKKIQHVLLVSYEQKARYKKIEDYLSFASETILLLENLIDQKGNLMTISKIKNINFKEDNLWSLIVKSSIADFGEVELDYSHLIHSARILLSMAQLRQTVVGGASVKFTIEKKNLPLSDFLLRWTLGDIHGYVAQNIFVCFRYEPKTIKAFTDYATASLAALKIDHEAVVCCGSVLVYIQCPAYIPWYIMMHQEEIFNMLAEEGLKDIYECFISDVEESMQRPDNEEFMDDLIHLKEQMISDGIAQQKIDRFKVTCKKALVAEAINAVATAAASIHFHSDGPTIVNPVNIQPDATTKKEHMLGLPNVPFEEIALKKTVGEGTYATVFEATWQKKLVAIWQPKIIVLEASQLSLRIAAILKKIQHQNIVSLIGVSTDSNTQHTMLIMEYLEDGSLNDLLYRDKATLSKNNAISIALDVAEGLAYLHAHEIIHRNIKSSTILLFESKSRAKLSGFNSARVLPKRERANTTIGTLGYMAPEVLAEEPYDSKADVYSFGVVLYEMQTRSVLPIIDEKMRLKRVESHVQDVEFQKLIIECVKTAPEKRPTMEECVITLKKFSLK